jgi:hypothetical protein
MKSITRTIARVVSVDKRKRTVTLRPKGEESDYNGWIDVIGNGHTVPGLQMASKVFIIICDVELGKPVRQEVTLYNCLCATPSVWGNPTEVCAGSITGV